MTQLADFIHPNQHFARSVNIERDCDDAELLAGYVPLRRTLEALARLIRAMSMAHSDKAWSITGPYGSGKSFFAHFISCALAPSRSAAFKEAIRRLGEADPELVTELRKARQHQKAHSKGFVRAVTTARREPIVATVARASRHGVESYWTGPGRRPLAYEAAIALEEKGPQASAREAMHVLDQIAQHAPVLLIIDEMGKCLEYAASASDADLYLLQLIAERSASSTTDNPVFVVTLQHQAFDEYLTSISRTQKREWTKVQGRFEDVAFVQGPEQAFQLIASALQRSRSPRGFKPRLDRWAAASHEFLRTAIENRAIRPSRELIRSAYPLHPLALLVLPELCTRYGQHDRTLFSFLTNATASSLPGFLAENSLSSGELPVAGLDRVFDYFVEAMSSGPPSGTDPGRWLEIQSRVREAHGLDDELLRCLKAVAVLNLAEDRAGGRASKSLVEFAVAGPLASATELRRVRKNLGTLEAAGFITYVDFADEYRIWRGSDFDVRGAVVAAREFFEHESLIDTLARANPLRPVVARRHSQATGTLRYFEARYATANQIGEPQDLIDPTADGLLLYVIDPVPRGTKVAASSTDGRPLVIVVTDGAADLRQSALDSAAALNVLENEPTLRRDPIARQEVRRRVVLSQDVLRTRLAEAYDPDRREVTWWANGKRVRPKGAGALSTLLSELCDIAYPRTPRLQNEMLNRRVLTSQGAKTRRELIEAMIRHPNEIDLGISGTGPDWAMYRSVLAANGLHDPKKGLGSPSRSSGLRDVWGTIQHFLDGADTAPRSLAELYEQLMAPPIGMKDGPIPVLLAAALIVRRDDVSLYQEGTFQPTLSAEVMERLVKAPDKFTVKRFDIRGVRRDLFRALENLLASSADTVVNDSRRNSTLLSVVKPLIAFGRSLPAYTQRTRRLSGGARAVRDALLTAREPDELLFTVLPTACGIEPFKIRQRADANRVHEFSERLASALDELRQAYPCLLDDVQTRIATDFGVQGGNGRLREDLRIRARHLVDQIIDRQLRSFLLTAINEDLEDREWLEALAMNTAGRPPEGWADEDVSRFDLTALELGRRFGRLEALHYDMRAPESSSADARRVVVTRPDGEEMSEVLWVDAEATEALKSVVAEVLIAADTVAGELGRKALLSLLLAEVLETEEVSGDQSDSVISKERSAKNA